MLRLFIKRNFNNNLNYYQILSLSYNATEEQVKAAFTKLAKIYHPDVSKDPESSSKFKKLAEAYAILSNTKLREEYDKKINIKKTINLKNKSKIDEFINNKNKAKDNYDELNKYFEEKYFKNEYYKNNFDDNPFKFDYNYIEEVLKINEKKINNYNTYYGDHTGYYWVKKDEDEACKYPFCSMLKENKFFIFIFLMFPIFYIIINNSEFNDNESIQIGKAQGEKGLIKKITPLTVV